MAGTACAGVCAAGDVPGAQRGADGGDVGVGAVAVGWTPLGPPAASSPLVAQSDVAPACRSKVSGSSYYRRSERFQES